MAMSFLFLAVGSLVLVVAAPRFGLDASQNAGDWRGLWSEKNTLALFMVISGLAALCAMMELRRAWWLWSGMFALSAFLRLMSRGKTALLCFALVTALTGALWLMRRGSVAFVLTLWSTVTAGALVGFLTWQEPGVLLTAVGKDATLTGRTQIWTAVLNQVALHPLTGFGFAAFWERTSVPALIIRKQTGWVVPTAHNGWLDLLVQVGWIGVGLFVAVLPDRHRRHDRLRAALDEGVFRRAVPGPVRRVLGVRELSGAAQQPDVGAVRHRADPGARAGGRAWPGERVARPLHARPAALDARQRDRDPPRVF